MKKILYSTICILAAVSCSKELTSEQGVQNPSDGTRTVVRATIESDFEDAKTYMVDADGDRYIRWDYDDVIGIFGGPSTQNSTADVDDDSVGSHEGSFVVGGPYEDPEFAYYPYSKNVIYSGGTISRIGIPADQNYVAGRSISGENLVMVGLFDTSAKLFKFKNACSVIEVQLTGAEKITQVQLRSLSTPLAGSGSVQVSANPRFVLDGAATDLSYCINLDLKGEVQLSSKPAPFYFVVAPGTYKDLQVFVKTVDGNVYQKASTASHTVQERHILPMKAVAMTRPDITAVTDLSAAGCANTYVVAPSATGMFSFDVKHVDGKAFAKGDPVTSRNAAFADILWESEGCLLGDVFYDASLGKVYFRKVRPDSGNALISIFNDKNIVIWSWLIWCSDVKDQTWGAASSRYTFQDRFIGATWVPTEDLETSGDVAQLTKSMGLLFQYGHSVPIPGANTIRPTVRYEGENTTSGYLNKDGKAINKDILLTWTWQPVFHRFYSQYLEGWESRNCQWSIDSTYAHPLSMNKIWLTMDPVFGKSYATDVYVHGENALWKEEKTNHDPCPAGYRVPQTREMQNFYDDGNGTLQYTNGTSTTIKKNSGWYGAYTTREGNFIWIPKAGLRTQGSNMSSNSYAYTMAYWGDYVWSANSHWYDGTANIWVFDPADTQADLTGANGYGDSSSWSCTSSGDVVQKFFHMGGLDKQGPRIFKSASGKPIVGCVAEAMSVRCVKIQ